MPSIRDFNKVNNTLSYNLKLNFREILPMIRMTRTENSKYFRELLVKKWEVYKDGKQPRA